MTCSRSTVARGGGGRHARAAPVEPDGKSWTRKHGEPQLNEYDLPEPTEVPWLGKTVSNPEGTASISRSAGTRRSRPTRSSSTSTTGTSGPPGKYQPADGPDHPLHAAAIAPTIFVDQYNAEFNRYHPADEGRLHRQLLHADGPEHPPLQGRPADPGIGGSAQMPIDGRFRRLGRTSPSNTATRSATPSTATTRVTAACTIWTIRAATTSSPARSPWRRGLVYFYAETNEPLTPHTGDNWMLLLIDADRNPETGWYGYDFLMNKKVVDDKTTTLMRYDPTSPD